jgi:hypothetical protein
LGKGRTSVLLELNQWVRSKRDNGPVELLGFLVLSFRLSLRGYGLAGLRKWSGRSQVWWCMPVIPALVRLWQED